MAEDRAAQVGDDAVAQRDDEVEAQRACQGQHAHHQDENTEIDVDQHVARDAATFPAKAAIDDAPHRERQGKRRHGRNDERQERRDNAPAISQREGQQGPERGKVGAAAARGLVRRCPAAPGGCRGRRGAGRRRTVIHLASVRLSGRVPWGIGPLSQSWPSACAAPCIAPGTNGTCRLSIPMGPTRTAS